MNLYTSEIQLIESIKNGNNEAFSVLIEKYQQKVFQTCLGYLHNRADAEDLTQEVFIKVYRFLKTFRGDSSLGTWIYRITINKAISQLRKNRLRNMAGLNNHSIETHAANEYTDDSLLRKEQKEQIKQALNQLNAQQKTAFILFYYQDLSINEVAQIMNKSPKATESLVFRARQNLQKKLGRDDIQNR